MKVRGEQLKSHMLFVKPPQIPGIHMWSTWNEQLFSSGIQFCGNDMLEVSVSLTLLNFTHLATNHSIVTFDISRQTRVVFAVLLIRLIRAGLLPIAHENVPNAFTTSTFPMALNTCVIFTIHFIRIIIAIIPTITDPGQGNAKVVVCTFPKVFKASVLFTVFFICSI